MELYRFFSFVYDDISNSLRWMDRALMGLHESRTRRSKNEISTNWPNLINFYLFRELEPALRYSCRRWLWEILWFWICSWPYCSTASTQRNLKLGKRYVYVCFFFHCVKGVTGFSLKIWYCLIIMYNMYWSQIVL